MGPSLPFHHRMSDTCRMVCVNGVSTMSEYFRGWRRKCGCVTLVLACAAAVGWVRSQAIIDIMIFRTGRHWVNAIGSVENKLFVGESLDSASARDRFEYLRVPTSVSLFNQQTYEWYWHYGGFGVYESSELQSAGRFFTIPYWSLVLPLTALSAWLLLSKQRQPKAIEQPRDAAV